MIEVDALSYTYPRADEPAVASVSFSIERGEIFGALGDAHRRTDVSVRGCPPRYRDIGVHGDWITRWRSEGQATWRLAFQADAHYRASALVRCSQDVGDVRMHAEAGEASVGRPLTAYAENAGEWVEQELGAFPMSAGDVNLSVRIPDGGDHVVLKHLLLERLDDV